MMLKSPKNSYLLFTLLVLSGWGFFLQEALGKDTVSGPSHELPELSMVVGEQRLLQIPGLKKFSVSGTGIRIAPPVPGRSQETLLLKATSPGMTDLITLREGELGGDFRRIWVHPMPKQLPHPTPLKQALERLQTTEVLWGQERVTLKGTVDQWKEATQVDHLLRTFPKQTEDQITLTPELLQEGASRFHSWLQARPQFQEKILLDTDSLPNRLRVLGSVSDPKQRLHLQQQLRALLPLAEIELESLPDSSRTLHCLTYLLEIRKSAMRRLGIQWNFPLQEALRATPSSLRSAIEILGSIEALEEEGQGRILSRPELVLRSPGEAELFAGGELPIEMRTPWMQQVQWRSYGLSLKLKSTHSTLQHARLEIHTEVSNLEAQANEDRLPKIHSNRMKTQIDAKLGEPIFLSGLLHEATRNQVKGIPFLKDIPILGGLFSSEDYQENRSELIAILLPSLELPTPPMERFSSLTPKGPIPIPRNQMSPQYESALRSSPDFPWSALE